MGQCSTLPSEGRTARSSRRSDASLRGDDSISHRKDKYAQRTPTNKRSTLQVQTLSQSSQLSLMQAEQPGQPQSRNPESNIFEDPEPMEEDDRREGIPQPPEIAIRTRCYKLNLDSDMMVVPPVNLYLGPFTDAPPPLTYSSSDDSSGRMSPTQVAVQTAKIFRGITVAKDGTILSQNARATRSNRGAKNKKGEKSRQATKIEKAKDLVEETILTGKAPDSDEPANMMSLVSMGEYDDMKYLVRDGSKKLREGSALSDDALLGMNRSRTPPPSSSTSQLSPRKRLSPNSSSQRSAGGSALLNTPNKSRTLGLPQSAPPKLKGHPRDRPSTRKLEDKSRFQYNDDSGRGRNVAEGDWGGALNFSRGFHSIWNCGGTGEETGTISPTQVGSPKEGHSPHPMSSMGSNNHHNFRPVFEGRGESNFGQRDAVYTTTRAN